MKKESSGTTTMPNGSRRMWGIGLSDTCPPWYAVGSPSRHATRACAASWSVVEKRNAANQMAPSATVEAVISTSGFLTQRLAPRRRERVCCSSHLCAKVRRPKEYGAP